MKVGTIRSIEVQSTEVFVDINDLIIELMLDIEKCGTEAEKKVYRNLVSKLTELRSRGHAKTNGS